MHRQQAALRKRPAQSVRSDSRGGICSVGFVTTSRLDAVKYMLVNFGSMPKQEWKLATILRNCCKELTSAGHKFKVESRRPLFIHNVSPVGMRGTVEWSEPLLVIIAWIHPV